jgi:hypothetical protein
MAAAFLGWEVKDIPRPMQRTMPSPGSGKAQVLEFQIPVKPEGTPGQTSESAPRRYLLTIDARSGQVLFVLFPVEQSTPKNPPMDLASAEKAATAFARKHYPLWSDKLVKSQGKFLDHGGAGKEYQFIWDEQSGPVKTGNSVAVSIDAVTGNPLTYMARFQPKAVEPFQVSREEALRLLREGIPKEVQLRKVLGEQLVAVSPFTKPGRPVWLLPPKGRTGDHSAWWTRSKAS